MRQRTLALGAAALCVTGCAYEPTPEAAMFRADKQASRGSLTGSLFRSDQDVLSNESFDQILNAEFDLPHDARLAVMRFGEDWGWRWWSDDLARLDQEIIDRLLNRLRDSDRVATASTLPSLLTPERQTVPFLREAAARYRAHLLLIYRSASHTYEKQRFLAADQARSHCIVEAVLLDTRTGTVPFTATVVKTYTAEKSPDDLNFAETIHKAELRALGEGLDDIADQLVAFLDAAPPPNTHAAGSGS